MERRINNHKSKPTYQNERPIKSQGKYNLDFIDWNNEWERVAEVETMIMNGEEVKDKQEERRVRRHMEELQVQIEKRIKVENFPLVLKIDISKECYICLKNFRKGTKVRELPCKHVFCEECIKPWFKTDTVCPTCKFDLNPEKEVA
jgi:hypothetical protein